MKIYKSKSKLGFLRYNKKQLTFFKEEYLYSTHPKLGFEIKISNLDSKCVLFYQDCILIARSLNSEGVHWEKKINVLLLFLQIES